MSPIISTFFGIIVRLQFELGGKHHLPHVHAEYQEYEISIDFSKLGHASLTKGSDPCEKLPIVRIALKEYLVQFLF